MNAGSPEEMSFWAVRDDFGEVVSRAYFAGRITYITKHGERLAAVVPADLVEALVEAQPPDPEPDADTPERQRRR